MTKTKIVVGSILLLGVGHISGQYFQSYYMKKRLTKALPLLERALIDVISNGIENGFDKDEVEAALKEDFKFMKIVLGEK